MGANFQLCWDHITTASQATARMRTGRFSLVDTDFGNLPEKNWRWLAATYDGQTFAAWVDGVMESSTSVVGAWQTPSEDLEIGRAAVGNVAVGYFEGRVDEVRSRTTHAVQPGWQFNTCR